MAPRVFIGLVTHERSRFRDRATNQIGQLADRTRIRGWDVVIAVNSDDAYRPGTFPITRAVLLRSAIDQAFLEFRWRRYLARAEALAGIRRARRWARDTALLAGTATARSARYLRPCPFSSVERLAGWTAVVRLLNIDLSHVDLLQQARGADWALILEDDALADAGPDAMDRLLDTIDAVAGSDVAFINASRSIDHDALGVTSLLGPTEAGFRRTRVPVTNTVCAVAYSAAMLEWLPDAIERAGLVPVVPIDWRLNRAVMDAVGDGRLGPASCVWLDPAPFVQGSMH
jgi:hypothetical protein